MHKRIAALAAAVVALVLSAAPAHAGSNNGTKNWYWSKGCAISSTVRLDVTNYDHFAYPYEQQYHVDADRGSYTVKVYMDGSLLSSWNDFYVNNTVWTSTHTFKLVRSDGRYCSVSG